MASTWVLGTNRWVLVKLIETLMVSLFDVLLRYRETNRYLASRALKNCLEKGFCTSRFDAGLLRLVLLKA
ncbi:uncharacterized protein PHALS_15197 [Plasmopara halstedii]|uniref:Uncharacterized protein n=1 Tax=Plasmopara halstedii TaxID=4781 RepID=A0A0P1B551_PLAHL|nr:uncharacterized protein PHALS_15197 [Plasmopara halstedii]CEG49128.1 hypothetical protein PHALS_15197 [Plasmopara halstedii]|eukprot:XP_024585497.1 hypothetical protein PHALS_15197 [Plasmopara halstedii]